jgi:DNA processing protein
VSQQTHQAHADWRYWLALWRAPGVGPKAFARFLEHFQQPRRVFDAPRGELQMLGIKTELIDYLQAPDWSAVDYDLNWLEQPDCHLVTLHDPQYPARLKQLHDPSPILFVRGNVEALNRPQLAMVGARNPTKGGEQTAEEFAAHLASIGMVITSGLADGIDAASHRGALNVNGITVAVMGTGPDIIYPAKHRSLADAILAEKGALITEFMPGMPARTGNFPRRNRLISGLTLGTLVIEAGLRSGSLITARLAAEQGREVFAIPGSIHNPLAKGCHALIKEGAKLVETAEDIVEELSIYCVTPVPEATPEAHSGASSENDLDAEYQRLLEYMGISEPVSIDMLVERCGLNAETIASMLLILELRGRVATQQGGRYMRLS